MCTNNVRGIVFVDMRRNDALNVTIVNSSFILNEALQGSGIFFYRLSPTHNLSNLIIQKNLFMENTARHYGDTFASNGEYLEWVRKLPYASLSSGSLLVRFSCVLKDLFGSAILPWEDEEFVYLQLLLKCDASSGQLCGKTFPIDGQPMMGHMAVFNGISVFALPSSELRLIIRPLGTFYPNASLTSSISITPCDPPMTLLYQKNEEYPMCVACKYFVCVFS
jgi:hypothetical protein